MKEQCGSAMRIFLFFTLLLGGAYPLLVTGIAQVGYGNQANGSFIRRGQDIVGSEWIGQKFEKPGHFWSRPSAIDYNPLPSGGSNLGPTSQDLFGKIAERRKAGAQYELLYASASGLDPHISPAAAYAQAPRVAEAVGIELSRLNAIIDGSTEARQFGFLGEPRINVLRLNLTLERAVTPDGVYKH